MSGTTRLDPTVERLLDLAVASDLHGACALVDELLADGLEPEALLTTLIVDVQEEVGRRWATDRYSVAAEHAATAVIDAIIGRLPWQDGAVAPAGNGPVVIVCAEGEWHALSARLVAESLRGRGWSTALLGVSVPAAHLARQAADERWSAAVVTCSVAMNLPGASRSITALQSAGVPVLATGRAFGPDPDRARALGAAGWAPAPQAGVEQLQRWADEPPPLPTPDLPYEALLLATLVEPVVDDSMRQLEAGLPAMASYTSDQKQRTREDLVFLVRFLEAALLVDDRRVLTEYLDWLATVLVSRGVPEQVIGVSLRTVHNALPADLPRAHRFLLDAAAR